MENFNLSTRENAYIAEPKRQKLIEQIDLQNLFAYLKQEISSPSGLIDKTKALTNVLLKDKFFKKLINTAIKKKANSSINLGSNSIEEYTYTGIHTRTEKEDHYSVYAHLQDHRKKSGVVQGFLLRKEKTKEYMKHFLEARLILSNGKECTLKYKYSLPH